MQMVAANPHPIKFLWVQTGHLVALLLQQSVISKEIDGVLW
jgi:hypothetical protein